LSGKWLLPTAADTVGLGTALAATCPWELPGPRLLFLSGELGAGKTTLAAAMLATLGVDEAARSPSYALIETYSVRAGVAVHVDCYRLSEPRELEQLGLRDYFAARTLWLVEWPEHVRSGLPAPDLTLNLTPAGEGRSGVLQALSDAGRSWYAQLEQLLPAHI
jgi:tRNA threonylcarbamoyladenosine biosynthesis protein TsaE